MPSRSLIAAAALAALLAGCEMPKGGVSKVVLPEPESAGAKVMKEGCSSCHAAPSPAVHTAEEWPNTLYRMQEHRRMNGYALITPEQLGVLLEYLQRHSQNQSQN
jgi:cytochrome c5